jgi:hypothetical protein
MHSTCVSSYASVNSLLQVAFVASMFAPEIIISVVGNKPQNIKPLPRLQPKIHPIIGKSCKDNKDKEFLLWNSYTGQEHFQREWSNARCQPADEQTREWSNARCQPKQSKQ